MMRNKDFAVFILTHGRPDNVKTFSTLKKCGYTGKIFLIVDNEDKAIDKYINIYGKDRVRVFDKKAMADEIDEGNNFNNRKVIVHARNASFEIAKQLGITYFVQFDDDYYYFGYRYEAGAKIIKNLDNVFDILVDFQFVRYKLPLVLHIVFELAYIVQVLLYLKWPLLKLQ